MLNVAVLNCLPIDRSKFEDGSIFSPIYKKVETALSTEPLLPGHRHGYLSAMQSFLARTQDLRDLLDDGQLGELFADGRKCGWLSGEITQDRAPGVRQYLRDLGIAELTPDSLLSKLSADFLERQSDAWIERLYVFLNGQPSLRFRLAALPLVRLTNGTHVRPYVDGVPQAFLAGTFETGFPTVHPEVCGAEAARSFLISLELTIPDRVDDVIRNVLPKYRDACIDITPAHYAADIQRILVAFDTDSKTKREKLVGELRETTFVKSVSAADGRSYHTRPDSTFIATDRLKELLSGVEGAYLVDERQTCLRGQETRDLLETCGATRHLRLVPAPDIGWKARRELREKAGHPESSGVNDRVVDLTLFGLREIIAKLGTLNVKKRCRQAALLWDELALIEERRGKGVFTSEYTWTHYGTYRMRFDATFVQILSKTPWVPGPDGELHTPELVLFESLGWHPTHFLLSQIKFKQPMIEQLAKEAGFDPGLLNLLKELGVTTEAELRARLGIKEPSAPRPEEALVSDGANTEHHANTEGSHRALGTGTGPGARDQAPARPPQSQSAGVPVQQATGQPNHDPSTGSSQRDKAGRANQHEPSTSEGKGNGHRPFISFLGVRPEDESPDPDGD